MLLTLQALGDRIARIGEDTINSGFTTGVVTLATFVLNASQVGSERVAITGSIPQFVRFRAVRSGSAGNTVRLSVTLVRF
ncbi:MAG: hypothetical protein SF123_02070 [Chloroflexota bacterium]|nr:hypothetical protein [Chloroflexota bacterium]